MRALFGVLVVVVLTAALTACHGGGTNMLPSVGTQSNARLAPSPVATLKPARLWFSSCATCGIAMIEPKEVDVQVYTPTGTLLHSASFGGGRSGGEPAIDLTSPDQRHVYVTMAVADNYVADIDTATYGVRYYHIPLKESSGDILALLVSPDGSRLYVPTTTNLYIINTLTRTYAGTVCGKVSFAALSPDGKTLYGVTSGGLTAINTTTLVKHVFAANPNAQAMAATTANLYVGTTNGVRIYNRTTLAFVKTVLSSLVVRLTADNGNQRLYAWIDGPSSQYADVLNTSTQLLVKTITNVFQGPFLDPVSHLVYAIDFSGNVCRYTPPTTYTKSCSFMVNSSVPFDIAVTH